ncbi:uncharacterized protein LOC120121165 [Hibiscus syriacus]|uniref:uncharacterized protein LOC120121165 n=1 Tax=Hibiscus syriacus TaxID=106335 RepID=UPI0019234DB5|nr:uncharacterized protein LOC120121165 [Hibiscus syriacus]
MIDFQEVTHELDLQDHPFIGPLFTWSNKQTNTFLARKLDRVLVNPTWINVFQKSFVEFLAPGVSDHCMAFTWLDKEIPTNRPKPFKFFNFWTLHPNFLREFNQSWQTEFHGNPMRILFLKLKHLKLSLKILNKSSYSDISSRVKQKRIDLEQQQLVSLKGEDSIDIELQIQQDLLALEETELLFLKQKAKLNWIKEGDKSSKFFHSAVAVKNKKDTIRMLIDDQGSRLESFDSMAAEVLNFFTELIGKPDPRIKEIDQNFLKEILNYSIPQDLAPSLVKEVTPEEINEAILGQGNEKSLGPDGFTPYFFQTCLVYCWR